MKGLGLIVWGLGFFYSFCLGSWVFSYRFCLVFRVLYRFASGKGLYGSGDSETTATRKMRILCSQRLQNPLIKEYTLKLW